MAKYSTGGGSGGSADACELCGTETTDLQATTVAGARLEVCSNCLRHGEDAEKTTTDDKRDEQERRRKAAQNTARMKDAQEVDHDWESGADYEDDPLPYLLNDYGDRLREARQDAGYQIAELADELDVSEDAIIAVEQGRAIRAGIGGSLIAELESFLDIELTEG
ncbi:MAG: multiprotein-bridging factor 1 family protein [Natronomonas sp.]